LRLLLSPAGTVTAPTGADAGPVNRLALPHTWTGGVLGALAADTTVWSTTTPSPASTTHTPRVTTQVFAGLRLPVLMALPSVHDPRDVVPREVIATAVPAL
jgi:hypothetical protein